MALITSSTRLRRLPDEKHLAFAVSIVLSKPNELTIEEYIGLLRQHVAKGRRENALSSVYRHLDSSSYWRSEYERMKDALDSAEMERLDLKLEVDRLKAKDGAGSSSNPVKKRKKPDDTETVPVPRSPKRAKPASREKDATLTASNVGADFSFAHLGEPGTILMRSFYQAHALLKSQRTDPALLAQHLVRAANAVSDVLQQLAKQRSTSPEEDLDSFKAVLAAVSRTMQSVLIGYDRISTVARGAEMHGHVVYAYMHILENCTIIMSDFAKAALEEREAVPIQEGPSTSKCKAKQIAGPMFEQKNSSALSIISSFIAGSIDLLDAKTEAHKPLFEGLAYILIEKVATCLYILVFGRSRGATVEEEIASYGKLDDIEDADQAPSVKSTEVEVKVAKFEAPYLVQLLAHLMQAAPAHFGASITSKSGKSKATSKQKPLKDSLAITAKERLQRTLVNCMFGTEDAVEDDPFLDCLRKPAFSGSLPAVPEMKEPGVQECFKEEVWRLLGWDILSREGGW